MASGWHLLNAQGQLMLLRGTPDLSTPMARDGIAAAVALKSPKGAPYTWTQDVTNLVAVASVERTAIEQAPDYASALVALKELPSMKAADFAAKYGVGVVVNAKASQIASPNTAMSDVLPGSLSQIGQSGLANA